MGESPVAQEGVVSRLGLGGGGEKENESSHDVRGNVVYLVQPPGTHLQS